MSGLSHLALIELQFSLDVGIAILTLLILSTTIKTALGFGNALIFISFASFYVDVKYAIVLCTMWGVFLGSSNLWKYRRFVDWKYTKRAWVPALPGCILGSLLIVSVDSKILKLIFSAFILLYVLIKSRKLWKDGNTRRKRRQVSALREDNDPSPVSNLEKKDPQKGALHYCPDGENLGDFSRLKDIPAGVFYPAYFSFTFLGGLIAAAGPINIVILEKRGFEREEFIANFSATTLPFTFISLGIYLTNGLFPVEFIWLWLIGFPVMYLAAKLGYFITSKLSVKKFKVLVFLMLLAIALNMMVSSVQLL